LQIYIDSLNQKIEDLEKANKDLEKNNQYLLSVVSKNDKQADLEIEKHEEEMKSKSA
jgi:hypothetical protein